MHDPTVWLLVADALVAVAMLAHGGFRPLVPARIRSQPARSDRGRSR